MDMNEFRSIILKDLKRFKKRKDLMRILSKLTNDVQILTKDKERSDKVREKANALYAKKKIDNKELHAILQLYNESLATAPLESEVQAKAYANKSALLLRMRKYKESVVEAEKALKITNSVPLKVKLLCRKAECLTALGSSESRSCIEKAKFILSKSEVPAQEEETLKKTLDRAQVVVNREKLDTPKDNRRIKEVSKIIADVEKRDIWSSVKIDYTKKYGRHLVAARDFEPGEVILVEKPYLSHLTEPRTHQYCYKCFNYLWTAVPCDHCDTRMFCSEECKNEAWKGYHELECSIVPQMKLILSPLWNGLILFLLSIFFKTLKEAGSIEKLQADFQSLEHRDPCNSDLSYMTILAAPIFGLSREDLESYTDCSTLTLMCLAKLTTIFGRTYELHEIDKLMKNDTAIFTGSLLLKFGDCISASAVSSRLIDPTVQDGSAEELVTEGKTIIDQSKTPVLNLLAILTTVGCIPNVLKGRSIDHKSVMYALQPIKAGTRLIEFNRSDSSIYHSSPKSQRQAAHREIYKSSCDCRACTEDWSLLVDKSSHKGPVAFPLSDGLDTEKFLEDFSSLMAEYKTLLLVPKSNYPDIKAINKVKSVAVQIWKHSPLPSSTAMMCTLMVVSFFTAFFSPDKDIFKVPK